MTRFLLPVLFLFLCNVLLAQVNSDGDPLPIFQNTTRQFTPAKATVDLTTIPAGDEIEGDYIGEMKFTRDGDQVWVLNRTTNNITVIDWATKAIVQNIPVGIQPIDLDFSDELAVVACLGSNEVYFIQLSDYSIADVATVSARPAKVHVSGPGNIAVVGCDESSTAEVFNLNTLANTLTINAFPVGLYKFSFITSNPRNSVYYSNFRITPDESYLVNGYGVTALQFWDLSTGMVTANIPEAAGCGQIELSGDGTKLVAMRTGNPGQLIQIDVATQSFTKQVTLDNTNIFSSYSPPAVNTDGSRAYVPANPGNTALINFNAESWQTVETGNTPDWVGTSASGTHFIAGDFYIAVVNAETGTIQSSLSGISIQNGAVGQGNRIVASDPLRYESLVFYDFINPVNLTQDGNSSTGSDLEADATYAVKFTADGSRLLAINSLSGTLSVIDVASASLEGIIDLGSNETFQVDVTSDGQYALVAKRLDNRVAIIDLQTSQIVADVPSGGSKPDQVFVLPGDQYAYAINAGSNDNIGVIKLDGANSGLETTIDIGNTGISWTNYGIRSDLKFTPDGQYALVANPFDSQVQILELSSHSVLTEIALEGFPLQIAISEENELLGNGVFAAVTLKDNDELALLFGQDETWSLIGTYPCIENPVRVTYDPRELSFWIASSEVQSTQRFSLQTLEFIEEINYEDTAPIAIQYAATGRGFTLQRSPDLDVQMHHLLVTDSTFLSAFDLPALPIHHFDITPDGLKAAVAHPATDEVTLFVEDSPVGFQEIVIPMQQPYRLFPNPVAEHLHFTAADGVDLSHQLQFRLRDLQGRLLVEEVIADPASFTIERQQRWSNGVYVYELWNGEKVVQRGKVVLQ